MESESKFIVLEELRKKLEKLENVIIFHLDINLKFDVNALLSFLQKCCQLEKEIQEKDEKISDLESFVTYYKEELQNYQRLNNRKLNAYEAILEM